MPSDDFERGKAAGFRECVARLENPDEAMVEAVEFEICGDPPGENDAAWARRILFALARTLTEGQENSE